MNDLEKNLGLKMPNTNHSLQQLLAISEFGPPMFDKNRNNINLLETPSSFNMLEDILKKVIYIHKLYCHAEIDLESFDFEINNKNINLTKRQTECLMHLAMGKPIKQIANILKCSESNIENHINRLKQKFGLYTTTSLKELFWRNVFLLI